MLEEIGRRPGAAPKEEEESASLGGGLSSSSGLHRVGVGMAGRWAAAAAARCDSCRGMCVRHACQPDTRSASNFPPLLHRA